MERTAHPGAPAEGQTPLAGALEAWRAAIGPEFVLTDAETIRAAETATFLTTQRIPAVLRPSSREEVQACVRVANRFRVPIYPVSRGKNWGYGSRVPPRDGCVLVELARMDRILDFDERLGYVTVEPGVTFAQLYQFLQERGSALLISVTGSVPDSSIVGNALERGFGRGPDPERFAHVCDLEVVLPTGELIRTGFGRFPNAGAAPLHRWGVGPHLDGMFSQSNFGIVTSLALWLSPAPAYTQVCYLGLNQESKLPELLDALQSLILRGVVHSAPVLVNDYRSVSYQFPFPWLAALGETPLPQVVLDAMLRSRASSPWFARWSGWIWLGAAGVEIGEAERRLVADELSGVVDRLVFRDGQGVDVRKWEKVADQAHVTAQFERLRLRGLPGGGVPSPFGLLSTYWRKTALPAGTPDPDRDRCGVIWCAPAVPFIGQEIYAALEIMGRISKEYRFEPSLSVTGITGRAVYAVACIVYDRDVAGEDERALSCHQQMLDQLAASGYIPYRLGIQAMGGLPTLPAYDSLLLAIKQTLDPNGVLAPGRYVPVGPERPARRPRVWLRPDVDGKPRASRHTPRTLAQWLPELQPSVSRSLIGETAFEALSRIASVLPPEFGQAPIFLECPLDTPEPLADLSVSAWNILGGPGALLVLGAGMEEREGDRWAGIRAFATEWRSKVSPLHGVVDEVWLEFDVDPAGPDIPLPSVFFSSQRGPGPARREDGRERPTERVRSVAVSAVELLTGESLQPARRQLLQRCFDELSQTAQINFVGAMLGRNTADLRLIIQGLSPEEIPKYLKRVGLSSGVDDLAAMLNDIGPHLDLIWLAIDAGEVVGPRVGLECYRTPQNASNWQGFLSYLVQHGLCLPEKAAALQAYARRRLELDGRPVWRQIHHLKLAARTGGNPEAKAYLGASLAPPAVRGPRRPSG